MWHQKYIVKHATMAMAKDAASLWELPGLFAKGVGQAAKSIGGIAKELPGAAKSVVGEGVNAAKSALPATNSSALEAMRKAQLARQAAKVKPPLPPAP